MAIQLRIILNSAVAGPYTNLGLSGPASDSRDHPRRRTRLAALAYVLCARPPTAEASPRGESGAREDGAFHPAAASYGYSRLRPRAGSPHNARYGTRTWRKSQYAESHLRLARRQGPPGSPRRRPFDLVFSAIGENHAAGFSDVSAMESPGTQTL